MRRTYHVHDVKDRLWIVRAESAHQAMAPVTKATRADIAPMEQLRLLRAHPVRESPGSIVRRLKLASIADVGERLAQSGPPIPWSVYMHEHAKERGFDASVIRRYDEHNAHVRALRTVLDAYLGD